MNTLKKEKNEKEKKKEPERMAVVYGPPPRPDNPYNLDELKLNIPPSPSPSFTPPKPPNEPIFLAGVYGPPPRPPRSSDLDLKLPTQPEIQPPPSLVPTFSALEPKSPPPRKKDPPK